MNIDKKIKNKAQQIIHILFRRGDLKYPDNCQNCGVKSKLHAHHIDYNKPTTVVFLCPACHGKVHSKKIEIKQDICFEYFYDGKSHRTLTVGRAISNGKTVPAICIVGRWLEAIGWVPGSRYEIFAINKTITLKRLDQSR